MVIYADMIKVWLYFVKMTMGYGYILHTTACLWGYMRVRVYEDVLIDHSHCVEGGACESGVIVSRVSRMSRVIDQSHCD
jgi:hypothetical protein